MNRSHTNERGYLMSDDLFYRLEARFTQLMPIGLVADGIRMHNRFAGRITAGELAGASVDGVDYFRIRSDGVGVVTGHELVEYNGARIAVAINGYGLPPAGLQLPPLEELAAPDFEWPDVPFSIEVFATFETAEPTLAYLNRTTVVHTGYANMGTRELVIEARRPEQLQRSAALAGADAR